MWVVATVDGAAVGEAFLERLDRVVALVRSARPREVEERPHEQARVGVRAGTLKELLGWGAGRFVFAGQQVGQDTNQDEPEVVELVGGDAVEGTLAGCQCLDCCVVVSADRFCPRRARRTPIRARACRQGVRRGAPRQHGSA